MGLLSSLKAKLRARKTSKQQQKPQPLPASAQQGLADEHLASVPPPHQQVHEAQQHQAQQQGQGGIGQAGGEPAVQKKVQTGAPVPLAANAPTNPPITTTAEPTKTTDKKDKMASDEDYASFLDKANEDPSAGTAKSQSKGKVEFKAVDAEVPAVLGKNVKDAFYVSDADEPFEAVALKFSGKSLPDEAAFAKLVNHPSPKEAEVQIMDIGEWDPQGQYKEVVDATREASKGSDVRVYRIAKDGTRAEYWVVGLEGGRLVGVKALAVES